ncbi:MAG TPA: type IV toxin-antitoxin system AbiEi family antitoxin domain-containing protein [Conexibacter sp.]|nr:type IV toxin-antitoxin system AbiEi family antitoxin domain-containing protein [Conexibacter sp.]
MAAAQHGVVARRQLLATGTAPSTINRRVASGHLIPLHRGVYAVGHDRLTRYGYWMAAVLAAGPGALLSHRDAAALHGLRSPGNHRRTHVTTPARAGSTPRLQLHRTTVLDRRRDVATVAGIPATSVARTLVDFAGIVPREQLAKALEEAERQRILDVRAVEDVLRRTSGRHGRGHATIAAALERLATTAIQFTRSPLEDALLPLLDAHGLPRPATNMWMGEMEVDACWPDHRVVAELDGWGTHSTRDAFVRDRVRANELQTNGWIVLRFTHGQVVREPDAVARTIALALRRGSVAAARPAAR